MKAQSRYQISAGRIGPLSATNPVIIEMWLVLRLKASSINFNLQPSTYSRRHVVRLLIPLIVFVPEVTLPMRRNLRNLEWLSDDSHKTWLEVRTPRLFCVLHIAFSQLPLKHCAAHTSQRRTRHCDSWRTLPSVHWNSFSLKLR